ncbi:transporter substrate-binding domain-containing protein [Reinekea marinisedimentorum]|uniref:Polar amino acid transport system substrate-binding protein n=1 Tax=Reinekea marinisedimentorum TaxID=230495 RepID=A0A4R3HXL6_9GAMM|nr:transporter substrate-binding domain-containing protein [Reinekea marinisedimentorum]TCS38087.1 polar amino acid transport system substrate-binding protein [Reinekea marinisedimentorum]
MLRLIILTFTAVLVQQSYAESFTFCLEDQANPPFIHGPNDWGQSDNGLFPDLVAIAAKEAGMDIQYIRRPWKRCQQSLKQGEVDALYAFIYTAERDQWAAFPKTKGQPDQRYAYLGNYKVFTHKNSSLNWDGTAFSDPQAMVQSIPGYVADQRLKAMQIMPQIELQPMQGLEMVSRGRIDGYVIDRLIGWELAHLLNIADSVKTIEQPFMEQPWYIAFSKQAYGHSRPEIEAFWTALEQARIRYSPTLEAKYIEVPE